MDAELPDFESQEHTATVINLRVSERLRDALKHIKKDPHLAFLNWSEIMELFIELLHANAMLTQQTVELLNLPHTLTLEQKRAHGVGIRLMHLGARIEELTQQIALLNQLLARQEEALEELGTTWIAATASTHETGKSS